MVLDYSLTLEQQMLLLQKTMILLLLAEEERPRAARKAAREYFGAALELAAAATVGAERQTFVPACCEHFHPWTCERWLRWLQHP